MHAHADFNITITKSSNAELTKITEYIESLDLRNTEVSIDGNNVSVEDSYDIVFLDDIIDFVEEIAALCPNVSFTVKGCTDTSESAGEYLDFEMKYENKKITVKWSDWYVFFYANDYETFEEFSESYGGRYSEEFFNGLKYGEWYALERDICHPEKNEIVSEVPLTNTAEEVYPFDGF